MDHNTDFDEVMGTFGPSLMRLARTYEHEPAHAEDLYQDICLAIWQALPKHRGESTLRTFIYRIAHNRALTHGWRQGCRGVAMPLQEALDAPDPSPDAEQEVDHRQRREALEAAVRALPMGLRQPVSLKLEGLEATEIAEILGLSVGNVRVRLHRARRELERRLRPPSPSGVTSHDS